MSKPKSKVNVTNLLDEDFTPPSPFQWNDARSKASVLIATGYTTEEVAKECECTTRTIYNWKAHEDFSEEVDRLSLMVDIASRAERLRIAMRLVRKKGYESDKDLLDWLKFAQSETDGVKLDLTKLATALSADEAPVADTGQTRSTGSEAADAEQAGGDE